VRTYKLGIKGITYQVEIEQLNQSPIEVTVNGRKYSVEIFHKDSQERATKITTEPSVSASPKTAASSVTRTIPERQRAPSDGVDIKVSVGDHVEVGQVLCTLEAMKMEMAINSVSSGTVAKISVETGQTVNHGETLCIIA